jgi:hypothetical protein
MAQIGAQPLSVSDRTAPAPLPGTALLALAGPSGLAAPGVCAPAAERRR